MVVRRGALRKRFRSEFFECEDTLGKLRFEADREVFRKAVEILQDTIANQQGDSV
jgi:hypothetical protein